MRALAGKLPSSGRSGPTPQAGFPPLPEGEGDEAPPRLQLILRQDQPTLRLKETKERLLPQSMAWERKRASMGLSDPGMVTRRPLPSRRFPLAAGHPDDPEQPGRVAFSDVLTKSPRWPQTPQTTGLPQSGVHGQRFHWKLWAFYLYADKRID